MPPRRKQSDFLQCRECCAIFTNESDSCHSQQCSMINHNHEKENYFPVMSKEGKKCHDYIHDKILHGSIQNCPSGIKLDAKTRGTVLLHPATMVVCSISKLGFVTVCNEGQQNLYIALPNSTMGRTSIAFCDEDELLTHNHAAKVMVYSFVGSLHSATKITISGSYDDNYHTDDSFKTLVIRKLWDTYVSVGKKYQGQEDNVPYQFEIDGIEYSNELDSSNRPSFCDSNVSLSTSRLSIANTWIDSDISGAAGDRSNVFDASSSFQSDLFSSPRYTSMNETIEINSDNRYLPNNVQRLNNVTDFYHVHMGTVIEISSGLSDDFCEREWGNITERFIFSGVGGLSKQLHLIKEFLSCFFSSEKQFDHGLLLFGPSGCGKSLVAETMMKESNIHSVIVSPSDVFLRDYVQGGNKLREVFNTAWEKSPSIVVLDKLDTLCEIFQLLGKNKCDVLAELIDHSRHTAKVLIIATAQDLQAIEPVLRRPHRLDFDVEFSIPDQIEKHQILTKILQNKSHNLSHEEMLMMSESAHGFTGSDMNKACNEAEFAAYEKDSQDRTISYKNLAYHIKQIKPESLQNDNYHIEKVKWNDIAGMHDVKEKLKEIIELPLKHSEILKRFDVKPDRGVLLYGPPGCSKTMIAKALATESAVNFIPIKGSELFSKWVGESERAIRELFKRAKKAAPCIIFFDEIDALVSERGSTDGSEVGNRVVTQLLVEMDGVENLDGVFILAATNRPDILDPALLRPGRLGHSVYIPLPDFETRREMLNMKLKQMPVEEGMDIEQLVLKTDGYSGAEVVAVCHESALLALGENFPEVVENPVISIRHFEEALLRTPPRIPKETIAFYEALNSNN